VVVGLTGGIGSGKSTVARMLRERGAVVIDADAVARDVVEPGGPAYPAVVARFGPGVVRADGSIDRAALADVVFSDPAARADLNAAVHPAVGAEIARQVAAAPPGSVVVVEVPLLVEAGWRADVVVVVDCPEDVAVRRLVAERKMDEADARRRAAAQASRAERLAAADHVVPNEGSLADLEAAVDRLWPDLVRASG
jgi:dephospho-CoA kinase